MAELFAEYEDEYVALIQQIVKHIRFMENLSDGTNFFLILNVDAKKRTLNAETLDMDTIKDAQNEMTMAQQHLERLRMQARSVKDPTMKADLKAKVKKHAKTLRVQKNAIRRLSTRVEKSSISNYSSMEMNDNDVGSSDRLLRLQRTSQRTSDRLQEVRRMANDTESSAKNSLSELQLQREVLLSARQKAVDTQDIMGEARRILGRMGRRNTMNNLMWYLLMTVAIIVLTLLVYVWLFR